MSQEKLRHRAGGFTLVELLIVVIILAILAAIVVPQFAASTSDAKEASVDNNLQNMRTTIDIYFQQHGEYPSANADGLLLANSSAAFISQLTKFSNADGTTSATKTGAFIYGPYLRRSVLPADPIKNSSNLVIVTTGALPLTADAADVGGWKFDNVSGQFILNHTGYQTR